jgi:hypothetical protein
VYVQPRLELSGAGTLCCRTFELSRSAKADTLGRAEHDIPEAPRGQAWPP